MGDIVRPEEFESVLPRRIKRPCDYGLDGAISNLEIQLGTIEALNRMVDATVSLREKIRDGKLREPIPGTAEFSK